MVKQSVRHFIDGVHLSRKGHDLVALLTLRHLAGNSE